MFEARLAQARKGRGILFCGAGFSADCLNFDNGAEIGVGAHLLDLLNSSLDDVGQETGFRDLRNAADAAEDAFGEHGLLGILQRRFEIENVTADMVDILTFPWERIYTTNYDDAIEKSLLRAKINARPLNNLDPIPDMEDSKTDIVYIHGRAKSWNIKNFKNSCVLGASSYAKLDFLRGWLDVFRQDLDRAEIVIFVGFNANDFHLNEVLNDVSGIRDKVYFINRSSAVPDVDVKRTQLKLGNPLYIGRQGLADVIRNALRESEPAEPLLSSFSRFERCTAAPDIPATKAIEDLLILGAINEEQLARDIDEGKSDYRVARHLTRRILADLASDINVAMLVGDICDGKTLILAELIRQLNVLRPVFTLRIAYEDVLNEVSEILVAYPDAVLVVENCFDMSRERLLSISRSVASSGAILLLSARTIAAEARSQDRAMLTQIPRFREYRIDRLSDSEIAVLTDIADQIAGWSDFRARSMVDKHNFIAKHVQPKHAVLPAAVTAVQLCT